MLLNYKKNKNLMGCSIKTSPGMSAQGAARFDGQYTGLLYGHAYSINDVFTINGKLPKDK
jgi:hypothetical protein